MFWKVVVNKLCVVVCKQNNLDNIKCVWELDDEPQCTFQISKVEGAFVMELCILLEVVNHLVIQPYTSSILLFFSYHLMLQVWYNLWIREYLLHSKFNKRRSFWIGFSSIWFSYFAPRLEGNIACLRHAIM